MIKSIVNLLNEPPLINGFNSIDDVANYVSNTSHYVLLSGYLIFAMSVNKGGIKSFIVTTNSTFTKLIISIIYDGYSMIHNGASLNDLEININLITEKSLNDLKLNLINKFYN